LVHLEEKKCGPKLPKKIQRRDTENTFLDQNLAKMPNRVGVPAILYLFETDTSLQMIIFIFLESMNQKVISFEHHVNEVLKPKLNDYLASRDKIIEEQAEYLRLEETVSKLDGKKELMTKVDLGCNFFVQAEIDDCSKINVHLGSGLYAELSHDELFQFCKKKRNLLKKKEEFQTGT